jgi:hypothetical protein
MTGAKTCGGASMGSQACCSGTAATRVQSILGPGAYGASRVTSTGCPLTWGIGGSGQGSAAFKGPDRCCQLDTREVADVVASPGGRQATLAESMRGSSSSSRSSSGPGVCHDHPHSSSQCTWFRSQPVGSARKPCGGDVSSSVLSWEESGEGQGMPPTRGAASRLGLGRPAKLPTRVTCGRLQHIQSSQAVVQQLAAVLEGCRSGACSNKTTSSRQGGKGAAAASDRSSLLLAAAGGCRDAPGPGSYELAARDSIEQQWRKEAASGRPSSMFAAQHQSRRSTYVSGLNHSLPPAVTPRGDLPASTGQERHNSTPHHRQQKQQLRPNQTTAGPASASHGLEGGVGGGRGGLAYSSTTSSRLPISSPFKSRSPGHEVVFVSEMLGSYSGRAPGPQYYRPRLPSAKHSFHVQDQPAQNQA